MVVEVCIGSSCHLKGSYEVIRKIEDFILREGLQGRVELKGAFCLGNCTEAVSVRVGGKILSFTPENAGRKLESLMEAMGCS